ncbi:hypothetical protein FH972_022338 [Carpinus fangiana]|uniref:Queuosine 5'-phosphate N-glycosylase/hydrolase n=1 Tax=Carpinus fangiana TaxID=176857 RepID=A0A5N6KSB8_9ROSI|nr:hypothetical protein FH972_022338 [Carpinus fangiana]
MAEGDYDNPTFDLLSAFKSRFGLSADAAADGPPTTGVLASAERVYDNSIDVSISMAGTRIAADRIWTAMQAAPSAYSAASPNAAWAVHELHPTVREFGVRGCVDFVFTMDLLNFCFWSDEEVEQGRFAVEYRGQRWTGYWSMVAGLRRALDEGVPITSSDFWQSEEECTLDCLKGVFRSAVDGQEMPLLKERLEVLREAGRVLYENFSCNPVNIITRSDGSAARLVNLLVEHFPSFRDTTTYDEERVKLLKRAQILVADLWACFDGGIPPADLDTLTIEDEDIISAFDFDDMHELTAFPDYRIPQMLHNLGVLSYSPPLDSAIRRKARDHQAAPKSRRQRHHD